MLFLYSVVVGFWILMVFICGICLGFRDLSTQIDQISPPTKQARVYSIRNHLRRDILVGKEIYAEFVTGSKCGSSTNFFCHICDRDVYMASRGKVNLNDILCLTITGKDMSPIGSIGICQFSTSCASQLF